MSEFNLEKYLSVERMKLLEDQKRYKEMIEELEQTNHELIEKNKALYHENSFLRKELEKTNEALYAAEGNNIRLMKELEEKDEVKKLLADIAVLKNENENLKYWYEKLNQKCGKIEGENKLLLSYQEQNRKLLESNKSLSDEIERLKSEIKWLSDENSKLSLIKGRHTQNRFHGYVDDERMNIEQLANILESIDKIENLGKEFKKLLEVGK